MPEPLRIADRVIGLDEPTFVVAEMSANHRGSLAVARELIAAIAESGADAVKLQTYTPDSLTIDSDAAPFRLRMSGPWRGRALYDLYSEGQMPWSWQAELVELANDLGLTAFSSPFDDEAVALLEKIGVPAYKIASFELVDHGLIALAAATGKPLIMSTGMASVDEIAEAVAVAKSHGAHGVALLKCTSAYPATADEMNLRTMTDLQRRFDVQVGLSDHTIGNLAALLAVTLGARIIEKHVCLERAAGGPDAHFSLEPSELKEMVEVIREAEQALGTVHYGPTASEEESVAYRRSLFAVADIEAGARFTVENVRSIRPADGLPPSRLGEVLRSRATRRIARGTPLASDMLGS
jgi:pseudaminic acid synthase